MAAPENEVLHLPHEMRSEVKDVFAGLRPEMSSMRAELRLETQSLRADVAAEFPAVERRMSEQEKRACEQIDGLSRAVVEYRSADVGHRIQLSELEARVQPSEKST